MRFDLLDVFDLGRKDIEHRLHRAVGHRRGLEIRRCDAATEIPAAAARRPPFRRERRRPASSCRRPLAAVCSSHERFCSSCSRNALMRRQERERHAVRTELDLLRLRHNGVVEKHLGLADLPQKSVPSLPLPMPAAAIGGWLHRDLSRRSGWSFGPPAGGRRATGGTTGAALRSIGAGGELRGDPACADGRGPAACVHRPDPVCHAAEQFGERHQLAHVNPAQQRHLEVISGLRRDTHVGLGFREDIERAQQILARETRDERRDPLALRFGGNLRIGEARRIHGQDEEIAHDDATARARRNEGRIRALPLVPTARTPRRRFRRPPR